MGLQYPKKSLYKIELSWPVVSEERMFENVEGQTDAEDG